jgi:hypothetical protein
MTIQPISTNPEERKKPGVQKVYTDGEVQSIICQKYAEKKSLRRVALEDYQGEVTHIDVSRMMRGVAPKNRVKRRAFGLSELILAPACPKCGGYHQPKRCPSTATEKKARVPHTCENCYFHSPCDWVEVESCTNSKVFNHIYGKLLHPHPDFGCLFWKRKPKLN